MLGFEWDRSGNVPGLLMNVEGVAALAGCSKWMIRTLARMGRLPTPVSYGDGLFYRYEDILEFIARHKRFFRRRLRLLPAPTEKPWWAELGTQEPCDKKDGKPRVTDA